MADGYDEASGDKRRVILDAARDRFLKDGFTKAAMEKVARAAQISTATLYAHFPSKTELFHNVILDSAEDFAGTMRAVRLDGGRPCERIQAFTRGYARFLADPFVRAVLRLTAAERDRIPDAARDVYERGKREVGGPLIAALEAMSAEGELKVASAHQAAGQLMGMIEHPLLLSALMLGDGHQIQRDVDHIADEAVRTFMARYGTQNNAEAA